MDIDFLAKQITNDHEVMKRAVETIMMQETGNDYIQFTIKNIENIAEQKAYYGVRVKNDKQSSVERERDLGDCGK